MNPVPVFSLYFGNVFILFLSGLSSLEFQVVCTGFPGGLPPWTRPALALFHFSCSNMHIPTKSHCVPEQEKCRVDRCAVIHTHCTLSAKDSQPSAANYACTTVHMYLEQAMQFILLLWIPAFKSVPQQCAMQEYGTG